MSVSRVHSQENRRKSRNSLSIKRGAWYNNNETVQASGFFFISLLHSIRKTKPLFHAHRVVMRYFLESSRLLLFFKGVQK